MAIWKNDEGESPRFGVSGGDQWSRQQGSNTAQNAPRNANALARRQFTSWTNLVPWNARWSALTAPQKTDWNAYAAATLFRGFTGQPAIIAGSEHFARYFANATFILGAEPSAPWTPPDAPTPPTEHAPFRPFLDPANSMALEISATTTEDLDFLFVALIPTPGKTNLTRSRTNRIGLFTLPPTAAGDPWLEPSAAAAAIYGAGALDEANQQWLLAWQIVNLYPFPVLDPCWSPPPPPLSLCEARALTMPAYIQIDGPFTWEGQSWAGTIVAPQTPAPIASVGYGSNALFTATPSGEVRSFVIYITCSEAGWRSTVQVNTTSEIISNLVLSTVPAGQGPTVGAASTYPTGDQCTGALTVTSL